MSTLTMRIDKHCNGTLCIPAVSVSATIEWEYPNKDLNYSLGDELASYPTLLETVFEFLDKRDLETVKLVSTTWSATAMRILQKRIGLSWQKLCRDSGQHLSIGSDFNYNNSTVGILMYDSKNIKLADKVCFFGSSKHNEITFLDYATKEVMHNLKYLIIECAEQRLDSCYHTNLIYECILFPTIPNINVSLVTLNPNKVCGKSLKFQNQNEVIRCMMVFSKTTTRKSYALLYNELSHWKSKKPFALGGGVIDGGLTIETQKYTKGDFFTIIFSQEESVETEFNAYSQVFGNDLDQFKLDVPNFKKLLLLRTHGIVFRFCCCGKDIGVDESAVLKEHFPKYQIVPLDVGGEIGWNSEALDSNEDDSATGPPTKTAKLSNTRGVDMILHGFTSVVVVITWGAKVNNK